MAKSGPMANSDNRGSSQNAKLSAWQRWSCSWWEMFAIDVRGLAVLRIAVGLTLLVDLARRFNLRTFFYGTDGWLSNEVSMIFAPPADGYWSLYWLADSPIWFNFLTGMTAISAAGLVFGFRSRTFTVISLILFWSLNVRNPVVTTGGHILLRLLLFWMVWLPVGKTWSVDAWLNRRQSSDGENTQSDSDQPTLVCTAASAGIILQVACMYFFSGIAKWNDAWLGGTALQQALQLDMYVKPLGHWLADYSALTMTATWSTLVGEVVGPLALFVPVGNKLWRMMAFLFFAGLHIGIWLTMSIGIFSWVGIMSWLVLLPGQVWHIGSQLGTRSGPNGSSTRPVFLKMALWSQAVCCLLIGLMLASNLCDLRPEIRYDQTSNSAAVSLSDTASEAEGGATPRVGFIGDARDSLQPSIKWISNLSMMTQEFRMFARPWHESLWFELSASNDGGQSWKAVCEPRQANTDFSNLSAAEIYQQTRGQHFRRALFRLATLKPRATALEEDQLVIAEIRRRFAKSWLELELTEFPLPITPPPATPDQHAKKRQAVLIRMNCWRRKIDLEFPEQPARVEVWASWSRDVRN